MTYYSTATLTSVRPPNAVFHSGRWWDTREGAPNRDAHLAAVGIVPLVDTVRPADTDTTTHDRSVALVDGTPTVVWTARPWTEPELRQRETPDIDPMVLLTERLQPAPVAWVQPTGAHDAYPPGWVVLDAQGDRWQNSLSVPNVWPLDVYGWTNLDAVVPVGPQPWVQPLGSEDAYALGDRVTHNGQTWESTHAANVWEPGVFGWVVVTP